MKTEDEILEQVEMVRDRGYGDAETNAVLQVLEWVVTENVMSPDDYLALSSKR